MAVNLISGQRRRSQESIGSSKCGGHSHWTSCGHQMAYPPQMAGHQTITSAAKLSTPWM